MKIGIAAENRPGEKRVILRPEELRDLSGSHEILLEKGAGKGVGIGDEDYERVGVNVRGKKEIYSSDIVVRIKSPNEEELKLMRSGSTIFSMLHLPGRPELSALLKKYRINAIPMEQIRNPLGDRMIEALHDTGYLAMNKGFELWKKDPAGCAVKIMGYGVVAWGAMRAAARKFARVIVLNKKQIYEMEKHIPGTDILVNGLNWPMEKRGKVLLVKRAMLKLFKPGSLILDLISNPEGQSPIETMRPTTIDNISYVQDGIIHSSCWGWPGLDPEGITRRYSIQTAPILNDIAENGLENLPEYVKKVLIKHS